MSNDKSAHSSGEVAALIERAKSAIEDLTVLCEFAYQQGYHELGYDPVVDVANAVAALARLSAPVPELTERERGVLRHALTGGRDVTPYRNHFAADEGHADMPTLRALVARGLMIERKNKSPITPDTLFHCTEAGAKAVGLHLPNDSRDAAPVPAREWVPDRIAVLEAALAELLDYDGGVKRIRSPDVRRIVEAALPLRGQVA